MPALRLRSGQAPAGIQGSLSLGNLLRTVLRQRANYAQSSTYLCATPWFAASIRALRLGNRQPVDLGELPAGDLPCPLARRDLLQGSYCYSCTASTSNSWDGVLATS